MEKVAASSLHITVGTTILKEYQFTRYKGNCKEKLSHERDKIVSKFRGLLRGFLGLIPYHTVFPSSTES